MGHFKLPGLKRADRGRFKHDWSKTLLSVLSFSDNKGHSTGMVTLVMKTSSAQRGLSSRRCLVTPMSPCPAAPHARGAQSHGLGHIYPLPSISQAQRSLPGAQNMPQGAREGHFGTAHTAYHRMHRGGIKCDETQALTWFGESMEKQKEKGIKSASST